MKIFLILRGQHLSSNQMFLSFLSTEQPREVAMREYLTQINALLQTDADTELPHVDTQIIQEFFQEMRTLDAVLFEPQSFSLSLSPPLSPPFPLALFMCLSSRAS